MGNLRSILWQIYLQVVNVHFESSVCCRSMDVGTATNIKEFGRFLHVCCIADISHNNETTNIKKCRPTWVTWRVQRWCQNKKCEHRWSLYGVSGTISYRRNHHTTAEYSWSSCDWKNPYLLLNVGWGYVPRGLFITIFLWDFKSTVQVTLKCYKK